MTDIVRIN